MWELPRNQADVPHIEAPRTNIRRQNEARCTYWKATAGIYERFRDRRRNFQLTPTDGKVQRIAENPTYGVYRPRESLRYNAERGSMEKAT